MNKKAGEQIEIYSDPLKNNKRSGILSAIAKGFFNLPIIASLWDKKNSPSKNLTQSKKKTV